MAKGEIYLVELPDAGGREQAGLRPAIILSDTNLPVVIVIPCTANMQALRFTFTMLLKPSRRNGLGTESVALLFHVRAIDRKRLTRKIGVLEKSSMVVLNKLIKQMLAL